MRFFAAAQNDNFKCILTISVGAYILFVLLPASAGLGDTLIQKTEEMMGTYVTVKLLAGRNQRTRAALREAFLEMRKVDDTFSLWNRRSELCRLNRTASARPVKAGSSLWELLKLSQEISAETDGAFDTTVKPLSMLWKDAIGKDRIPAAGEIEEARRLVDYRKVRMRRGRRVFFETPGMELDFGGIAKGYAVDKARRILQRYGYRNFVIEVSGDIFASGTHNGRAWKAGIRHPRIEGEIIATLHVSNRAVSTSGDYEQFKQKGHRRYHHLINPKTGQPAAECISVTVAAPESALADAYATAIFIMDPEKAKTFARKHPELQIIMILEKKGRLEQLVIPSLKKSGQGGFSSRMGRKDPAVKFAV